MARGGRRLSAEERALWNGVARSVTPIDNMPPGLARSRTAPEAQTPDSLAEAPAPDPLPPFEIGSAAPLSREPQARPCRPAAPRMDRRAFEQMRRGKLSPAGRLDLHGLTVDRARPALTRFLTAAQTRGDRLVLVITGKGRGDGGPDPVPEGPGVLRRQVPQWLAAPPLAGIVQQVSPAHRRHGGTGALYVYLRRAR